MRECERGGSHDASGKPLRRTGSSSSSARPIATIASCRCSPLPASTTSSTIMRAPASRTWSAIPTAPRTLPPTRSTRSSDPRQGATGVELAGVISSDDYPGSALAAVVAKRLGLPAPDPRSRPALPAQISGAAGASEARARTPFRHSP